MKTFTDTADRAWEVVVTVDTIRRVRDLLGLDLLSIVDQGNDLVARLGRDVVLLADVLFAVVKPQADQRQVTDTDFGRALSGDVLDQATTALLEELINFFPSPRRLILRRIWDRANQIRQALEDRAERAALAALADPSFEARLTAAGSGESAGSWPGSSGSPPAA